MQNAIADILTRKLISDSLWQNQHYKASLVMRTRLLLSTLPFCISKNLSSKLYALIVSIPLIELINPETIGEEVMF